MRDFDAQLTVHSDGTLDVVENLTIGFSGEWNGIVRDLSLQHNTAQGRATRLDVDVLAITDASGAPLRVEREKKDNGRTIGLRIWVPGANDADRKIVIRYRVHNAIRFYYAGSEPGAIDELYWNVTGNGWDMPIDHVRADVILPVGVTATRTAVYTGFAGATGNAATIAKDVNEISFNGLRSLGPHEGMSIGVGWPAGHIASRPSQARQQFMDSLRYLPAAIPFLVFFLAFRTWNRRGRDPEELSYVVRYEPIKGMSPAESGTLIDNSVDMQDITSTLVDLAVRGYVQIKEVTEKHLLGLTSSTDYIFHFLKPASEWATLAPHEQLYLEGLSELAPIGELDVRLSDLHNKFYKSIDGIRGAIYDSLVEKGFYLQRPDKVKSVWLAGAAFVFMAGFFLIGMTGKMPLSMLSIPALVFAMIGTALTLAIFGLIMPARTIAGARAREATLGFKEFLERVEVERYRKMITSPEMSEKYLPYAMAFG
ncbi:MAG TPA: DUF2207 domain-containing protein, partial [Gemmatimonadaceae bacterium]